MKTGRHRCPNEVQPSLFLLQRCDIVDVVFLSFFFFFLEKQIVSLSHWGVWRPGLFGSCQAVLSAEEILARPAARSDLRSLIPSVRCSQSGGLIRKTFQNSV